LTQPWPIMPTHKLEARLSIRSKFVIALTKIRTEKKFINTFINNSQQSRNAKTSFLGFEEELER
jgi:hypothetical protein